MKHKGVWWDPQQPEEQWTGTLRFDEENGAILDLTIPPSRPNPFPRMKTYDLIHGRNTKGTAITLIRAFERSRSGTSSSTVPRRVKVFANALIVGFHAAASDPMITSASVTHEHLGEWF